MNFGYSRVATCRRSILLSYLDLTGKRILELGRLDSLTIVKSEVDVYGLDWFSSDELREQFSKANRQVERILGVGYVVKSSDFCSCVDKKSDLTITNDVIEHVPNLINQAGQMDQLTHRYSLILISVLDNRCSFNVLVRSTDAIDVRQRHKEGM